MKKELSTKKAAKKLIKDTKKHPDWHTPEEVIYARKVLDIIKRNKKK